ncbi:MAG: NAD(P)/FAD-dependent oxidoreductase [Hyphomicrobiales bacterium]
MMKRVGIVGAGAMGLAAAYHALKEGHEVEVFEADTVPGGMAAHFDFGGLSIERFYHFVCKSDEPTFALLDELNIGNKMLWVDTKMGYYIDGKLYRWGDPIALLKFPLMSLSQKFRYGLAAYRQTKQKNFDHLENMNAKDWIVRDFGKKTYDLMWKRLLELKFFEYTDNISAAWIATRVKRIGNSRKSMLQETLGFIEGGSQTLIDALVKEIKAKGGQIHLGQKVTEITSQNGKINGIRVGDHNRSFDHIISTAPIPLISKIVPGLHKAEKEAYDAINNVGCVCVIVKLKQKITDNFWLNINDKRIDVPGIIEFSNLRPIDNHIVYVPYYMPTTHHKFSKSDDYFETEVRQYLKFIKPSLTDDDFIEIKIGRLKYSQPVCEPGFANKLPPIQTTIEGLQIADTCYYYPEDRGISESVKLGKQMVEAINTPLKGEAKN